MTPNTPSPRPAGQPSLDELTARFMAAKAAAPAGDAAAESEVEPHEVAGGFRASAVTTWNEAVAVFRLFGVEPAGLTCPPEWAALAALDTHAVAVPLAAGLFPQRVRDVSGLFAARGVQAAGADAAAGPVGGFTALRGWLRKALRSPSPAVLLVASGVAAALGDWADADIALAAADGVCAGPWRAVYDNQRAAVQWLRGRREEASTAWAAQGDATAGTYNRGMAALFASRPADSVAPLQAAAERLPDASGWCHLSKLYHSVARTGV